MSVAPKIAPPTICHGSPRAIVTARRIGSAATLASAATPCVTLLAISSPSERGRSAIDLDGLRADVVKCALHVHAHHLLAPGQCEVRIVHRLRGTIGGVGGRA